MYYLSIKISYTHLILQIPKSSSFKRKPSKRKQLMSLLKWNKSEDKPEVVFGNCLSSVPFYFPPASEIDRPEYPLEYGLPMFLVRCIKKIDTMIQTDGLYRINGDFEAVDKLK